MATVNLGRIKFVWQGAYSGATAYVADDVVSYNGSSYICILASTGNLPTNATYWSLMAQSGTDITSIAGLAQGDVLYYNGTAWVRLGAGTSGQFLKTNGSGANPAWSTVTSKIGAVTNTMITDTHILSTGSGVWTEISGFNATITPIAANSSILVMGHISSGCTNGGPAGHGFSLYRNVNSTSNVSMSSFVGASPGNRIPALIAGASESGSDWTQENGSYNIIDKSSTGLSYTLGNTVKYTMYWTSASTGNSVVVNRSRRDDNSGDDVRSTSSITLMEILA